MDKNARQYKTVEEYIASAPKNAQESLRAIRQIILKVAPEAQESIAYGMPAYKLHGKPLVYFAAFTNHIGLYATPGTHEKFAQQLAGYKQGKGSVQFLLNETIPYELITQMLAYKASTIK